MNIPLIASLVGSALAAYAVLKYAGHKTYLFRVLLFLDMFAAALIFRDADVTISSMTGLELKKPEPARWAKLLGGLLNHLQPNHCEMAITDDVARAKQAITLLQK